MPLASFDGGGVWFLLTAEGAEEEELVDGFGLEDV